MRVFAMIGTKVVSTYDLIQRYMLQR